MEQKGPVEEENPILVSQEKDSFSKVDYETWKESLHDIHFAAGFAFQNFNPTYYMDEKGDHYVVYTEDGERRGRKLHVNEHNTGISDYVDPSEIEPASNEIHEDVTEKYTMGEPVTVKRSDGIIESDWFIGDNPRTINGKKVFTVYKGQFPPQEGTLYKEVYQDSLDELNSKNQNSEQEEINDPTESMEKSFSIESNDLQQEAVPDNKELIIGQKIQNTSSLGELYRVIRDAGGIQGSSEYYSAEQIWERVQAYVENKADENIITRTDGLREKVKMLKLERELKKQGIDQKEVHEPIKPVEENNKEELSPEHKEEIPSPENQETDTSAFEIASMGRLLSEFNPQQQEQYEASIRKYGQAYAEKGDGVFESKAKEIKKNYMEAMEKIGLPSSQWGATEKWIIWDLAKQTYLAEHPEESNEHYKLGDPFENQEVAKDIIDRHVGWEVLGYAKSNPNFITTLDATKNSFSEIHTLLNEGEKNGKLPSYKLTELGKLVQQNKVS